MERHPRDFRLGLSSLQKRLFRCELRVQYVTSTPRHGMLYLHTCTWSCDSSLYPVAQCNLGMPMPKRSGQHHGESMCARPYKTKRRWIIVNLNRRMGVRWQDLTSPGWCGSSRIPMKRKRDYFLGCNSSKISHLVGTNHETN